MLRNLVLGAVSSLALVSAASAADMYVPGPAGPGGYKDAPYFYNWTGFYAGINGGYGWGSGDVLSSYSNANADFTPEGWFGGGQIGYNWQRDRIVLGVEADIQGAGIDGSVTTSTGYGSVNLDWFGTIRGRLGYTLRDNALVYATGGFAFGGVQDKVTSFGLSTSNSELVTGYVLGAGVEYAFNPKWSVKAEYQYLDFGKDTMSAGIRPYTASLDADHAYNTVRVGLNYHFIPAYEPLK